MPRPTRRPPWAVHPARIAVVGGLSAGVLLALAGTAGADPLLHHAVSSLGRSGSVNLAADPVVGPDVELRKEASLAGYVCYGLMAMTVVWGMFLATGWARAIVRRNAVYAGHLVLAVAAQTFGVMHAAAYVLQSQEHFSVVMTVVPFAGGGEPEVAFGIIGLELTIAASLAVMFTRRLNYRRFRLVHIIGTYVGFALSWLHVFTTSAEAKSVSLIGATVAAVLLVCLIFGVLRVLPPSRANRARVALQPVNA